MFSLIINAFALISFLKTAHPEITLLKVFKKGKPNYDPKFAKRISQSLLICFVSKLIPTVANLADKLAQVELTVIGEQNS